MSSLGLNTNNPNIIVKNTFIRNIALLFIKCFFEILFYSLPYLVDEAEDVIQCECQVSVSTMTYCVVQINFLPLPRFLKEVTMKTAEERYEETWNSYLELLNKDPRAKVRRLEQLIIFNKP